MAEQSTPNTDPTQQPAAAPGGETGAQSTPPATPAAISMSREELDRQLAEARRAGERTAKDTDEIKDLRAKAKRLETLEEASKSDLDKATDRATKAEALAAERATRYQGALRAAAFKLAARDKGIPADRLDDAYRLVDLAGVEVDEASDAVKGMDAAVDALITTRPWLAVAVTEPKAGGQGAVIPGTPKPNADARALTEAEQERRQAMARQHVHSRF